jgi:hypothetical protein
MVLAMLVLLLAPLAHGIPTGAQQQRRETTRVHADGHHDAAGHGAGSLLLQRLLSHVESPLEALAVCEAGAMRGASLPADASLEDDELLSWFTRHGERRVYT